MIGDEGMAGTRVYRHIALASCGQDGHDPIVLASEGAPAVDEAPDRIGIIARATARYEDMPRDRIHQHQSTANRERPQDTTQRRVDDARRRAAYDDGTSARLPVVSCLAMSNGARYTCWAQRLGQRDAVDFDTTTVDPPQGFDVAAEPPDQAAREPRRLPATGRDGQPF